MKKLYLLVFLSTFTIGNATAKDNISNLQRLKNMFQQVVIKKNPSLIPYYYSKDFIMYSNGVKENYIQFYQSHKKYYNTSIQYKVQFDNTATMEKDDKVAARIFITTQTLNTAPQKIEVILIAQYKDNKIYRVWEVTDPDWSKMKEFKTK